MELSITSMINIKKALVAMMEEELGVLSGRAYIVHKARIDEIKREIKEMEETVNEQRV